jgi:sortase (surface protein transpeptidase)
MRPAAAGVVLGLALAIGTPTAWSLTRAPSAAGAPVTAVLEPTPPSGAAAPQPDADSPAPVRLRIPALGVDSAVDPVGVAGDGQLDIPDDVDRVGWYRFGPAPGDDGSAVVAGHVDDAEQGLGALSPLRDAGVGTEIVLTDAAGAITHWRVVSRELIDKQVLPLDRIFTVTGPPRLTLVTCGGPFLPEMRSYRDNVVVAAEQVS